MTTRRVITTLNPYPRVNGSRLIGTFPRTKHVRTKMILSCSIIFYLHKFEAIFNKDVITGSSRRQGQKLFFNRKILIIHVKSNKNLNRKKLHDSNRNVNIPVFSAFTPLPPLNH